MSFDNIAPVVVVQDHHQKVFRTCPEVISRNTVCKTLCWLQVTCFWI